MKRKLLTITGAVSLMLASQVSSLCQTQDRAVIANPISNPSQPLPISGNIESRIGPLTFEGGYPTDDTVVKLYDEMDFQRAVQCYMWAIPIVSFAKWQEQHEAVFGQQDGDQSGDQIPHRARRTHGVVLRGGHAD